MICKKCILTNKFPGMKLDENCVCNYCQEYANTGAETSPLQGIGVLSEELKERLLNCKTKEEYDTLVSPSKGIDTSYFLHRVARQKGDILRILKEDWEKTVQECKGEGEYDCLVALSGGKDSTYLVYHLKEERGLRVLAYTVRAPFMTDVAFDNINKTVKRLGVAHITIRPPTNLYKEMYKSILTRKSHPNGYMHSVCYVCGPLMEDIAMNTAVRYNIPLVVTGYDPSQPDHIFYEIPQSSFKEKHVPQEFNKPPFTQFFWDPSKFPDLKKYPRVIAPYHVIDYNANEIMKKVTELGLVSEADPFKTNCHLLWLSVLLNLKKKGYNPLVNEVSASVRRGHMDREWILQGFTQLEKEVENNSFKKEEIELVLKELGLTMEDLLNTEIE